MWGRVDTVEVFDKFFQVVGDQLGMINSWVILTTSDPFIFGNNSWTVYKCIGEALYYFWWITNYISPEKKYSQLWFSNNIFHRMWGELCQKNL